MPDLQELVLDLELEDQVGGEAAFGTDGDIRIVEPLEEASKRYLHVRLVSKKVATLAVHALLAVVSERDLDVPVLVIEELMVSAERLAAGLRLAAKSVASLLVQLPDTGHLVNLVALTLIQRSFRVIQLRHLQLLAERLVGEVALKCVPRYKLLK